MARNLMARWALGVILAVAVQQAAHAGDRAGVTKNHMSQAFAAMAGGRPNVHPALATAHVNAAVEYLFSPVSPLVAKGAAGGNEAPPRNGGTDRVKGTGPATTPSERKTLTFFRMNSKFGDVSVQPVVGGGVNGAQLSMGF